MSLDVNAIGVGSLVRWCHLPLGEYDLKVMASRSLMWRNILPQRQRVSCSFARRGNGSRFWLDSSHAGRSDILGKIEWTGSHWERHSLTSKVACWFMLIVCSCTDPGISWRTAWDNATCVRTANAANPSRIRQQFFTRMLCFQTKMPWLGGLQEWWDHVHCCPEHRAIHVEVVFSWRPDTLRLRRIRSMDHVLRSAWNRKVALLQDKLLDLPRCSNCKIQSARV